MKTRKPRLRVGVHTFLIVAGQSEIHCPRTKDGYDAAIWFTELQGYMVRWAIWAAKTTQQLNTLKAADATKTELDIPERYRELRHTVYCNASQ